MLSNMKMLEVAGKVFEKYSLPDGASVKAVLDEVLIQYVFTEEKGVRDMETISRNLNKWKRDAGSHFVLEEELEESGVTVHVFAQIRKGLYEND